MGLRQLQQCSRRCIGTCTRPETRFVTTIRLAMISWIIWVGWHYPLRIPLSTRQICFSILVEPNLSDAIENTKIQLKAYRDTEGGFFKKLGAASDAGQKFDDERRERFREGLKEIGI